MDQHKRDPKAIVMAKIVMAWKSQRGYHTFDCPGCGQRNKVHQRRAINYIPTVVPAPGVEGRPESWKGDLLHFICVGCHREVHVSKCPVGGLIVL